MPTANPIRLYLEAREIYAKGDRDGAAQKLAESIGADKPSPVIINSLDKLMTLDTLPNEAVLQVLATEAAKRSK